MVEAHAETRGNIVAVEEVPREHTNRYGVLDPAGDDGRLVEVRGLVEKPDPAEAPSRLAIIGRYILLPEVFEHLARQQKGAGGEIQLTDAMARMIGRSPVPRPALRGPALRLRRAARLSRGDRRLRARRATDLRADMRAILERHR